jgi:hypothetical protein
LGMTPSINEMSHLEALRVTIAVCLSAPFRGG